LTRRSDQLNAVHPVKTATSADLPAATGLAPIVPENPTSKTFHWTDPHSRPKHIRGRGGRRNRRGTNRPTAVDETGGTTTKWNFNPPPPVPSEPSTVMLWRSGVFEP